MAASPTYNRFKFFWRATRIWFLGALGAVALGGLFYFLANLGPKRVDDAAPVKAEVDDPVMAHLSQEIAKLERQYRQAADVNLITEEARAVLLKAVEKQKELLRTYSNASLEETNRLSRLESELDSIEAQDKLAQIERFQVDGEELLAAGNIAVAGEKLSSALRLQKEVNLSSASSRYKNYVRETSLNQAVAAVEAAPLHLQKESALAEARKATTDARWSDALSAYIAARDAQMKINREYSRTRYADLTEVERLGAEIESLNAAGIAHEIEVKMKAGDEAMTKGQLTEAAERYSEVETLQLNVNKNYPRSRFVSSQLIEDVGVKRQTALSSDLADTIAGLDREIGVHLGKRQVVMAEQKITQIVAQLDKINTEFPKSSRLDAALRMKYGYLNLRQAGLRALQDEVYARLLPLPGVAEREMLSTELPQSLYVAIMNTNPSRNAGRSLPVDSVSWLDARDFCVRLSWVLGRSVRLPTTYEFRVALGGFERDGWSSQNSDGHSHPTDLKKTNSNGFADLVGNLAEWADAAADVDQAEVFGGSYLDTNDQLKAVPVVFQPKRDRARHVGMRIIVE